MALKMDDSWIGLLSIFRVDFGGLLDRQICQSISTSCWKMELSDFLVKVSDTNWMIVLLLGILVLKRDIYVIMPSFVATVEAVLLGSFMLAPLLQFPSTLLEALNRSNETSHQPSPNFCSNQSPALEQYCRWTEPEKNPRTPINTHHIWNIKHLKHWTFRHMSREQPRSTLQ